MAERLNNLPDKELKAIVKTWMKIIAKEDVGQHELGRGWDLYQRDFQGLALFLDYIKTNTNSKKLLDVGAGNAVAVNQLLDDQLGQGLSIIATGLFAPRGLYATAKRVPYQITPGETLAGIADNSIGGLLAHTSITYSASPRMVIDAFDRVLEPGGVLKVILLRESDVLESDADLTIITPTLFIPHLAARGYDIDTNSSPFMEGNIVLAIKPGGRSPMTAHMLLSRDTPPKPPSLRRR